MSDWDATSNLIVATWNLEWAPPMSDRGRRMRERLAECDADVVCLTEAFVENLPKGGQIIISDPDYGYPLREGRRKVILWTKHSWDKPDSCGSPLLPSGRFASGTLQSPAGDIVIIGVCIPWAAAHVSSGRRDRTRWEDNLRYLVGLGSCLNSLCDKPAVLLGDFNQAIPRARQRHDVAEALDQHVLGRGFEPLSANLRCEGGLPLIDHICVANGLQGQVMGLLPKRDAERRLSDHTGVIARVWRKKAPNPSELNRGWSDVEGQSI